MNPIELAIQKVVMAGVSELASNALAFEHIITFGKVGDPKLIAMNQHAVAVVKLLYPLLETAKVIIPSGTPIVGDVMDWVEKIYPIITGQQL